ncbi:MAG: IS4 family transposase [Kiritimatiellia bacterium]
MIDPWVLEETEHTDFKDKRLNERFQHVLSQFANKPTASIPSACGGGNEMAAAYRLFDNEKVDFDGLLVSHTQITRRRIEAQPVVLLIQDTTELDVTRPTHQVKGAGFLNGDSRRGVLLHLLHAFTPDGTPLGTVRAHAWAREKSQQSCAQQTRAHRASVPLEKKESYRWVQMQRHAQQVTAECPSTRIISICDSEADLYEMFTNSHGLDWIVRGCQNRVLQRAAPEEPATYLLDHLLSQPVLYSEAVPIRGHCPKVACTKRKRSQPRENRVAQVEVRSARVTLRPPRRPEGPSPAVTINVVLVREVNPPESEEPVEWMLLTGLPVEQAEQARLVVEYYKVRWMIEIFFRVLKSGCRVEKRRFENIERLLNCLAVYLIVSWRTLFVCRLARAQPDISCEVIFTPDEWKAVWQVVRQTSPPNTPPTLAQMTDLVAHLGGYVRRGNSPPGPHTVWIGLQRAHDFAICWRTFGPGSRGQNV